MMRRVFAIASVLLLSGFLPLAANAGLCAAKRCCRIHARASTAALGANSGCCNPTNCDATPHSVDATNAKSTTAQPQPSASEGCGVGDLAYWFKDSVLHPKPPKVPPKPKPPMTLAQMPAACRQVLAAPDARQ